MWNVETAETPVANMVEEAVPTRFVTHHLERDDLTGKGDLLTFFKNNPDFDLKATRLDCYLKAKPDALADVTDAEGTKARVRAKQRLYNLAPRYVQTSPRRLG